MLVWYGLMVAAAIALWRWRRRWRVLAPIVLFVAGTLVIFALAEGNVGTLYRHRAMIIPFVILIAVADASRSTARDPTRPARLS
jgi:peptidoglycan/LPS O-acetylase OafA/YrhL